MNNAMAQYPDWNTFAKLSAEVWQAQQVYVKANSRDGNVYFVCYDNCVMELQTSWELTEEQISTIAEKLRSFS